MTKLIAAAAVAAVTMGSQSAMAADNATADATATILTALDVTKVNDLRFGAIVKPTTGISSVSVSTGGTRSVVSGDASLQNSTFGAASFSVTGTTGLAYNVELLGTTGSVSGIVLDTVTAACTGGTLGGSDLARTLTGCTSYETEDLKVGGTISISSESEAAGAVNVGSVKATVAYQ